MKTSQSSQFFSRFFLVVFAAIGLLLTSYYLLSEIERPEYLVFYAPIFGLLLFGVYYLLQKGFRMHIHVDALPPTSGEMDFQ